eukprot:CAMPEP_0194079182 /NCGR_PEP_ID=MMETSP0149-20130528/5425_1 /TAXON_ID=122233 /ORGANISM="Chaetoceros debilis, Strain MM31A-1" /LENGTH=377 /DNA_ID=CAMNT_0038760599 /DNA_START=24 /DNA_END=1157 /DNA_ORIENTATION=-
MEEEEHKQKKKKLTLDAAIGSYIWSDQDLNNALLWFQKDDDTRLPDIIEVLLDSTGVFVDRPLTSRKKRGRDDEKRGPLLPHVINQYISMMASNSKLDYATKLLQSKLQSVASRRSKTEELYKYSLQQWKEENKTMTNEVDMNQKLFSYLKHPRTIVKMTYAQRLYDKALYGGTDNKYNDRKSLMNKMLALANLDVDVAETLLLMTLEPLKRKYPEGTNWMENIFDSSSLDPHLRIAEPTQKEFAVEMLDRIQETRFSANIIAKIHPSLICIVSKIFYPLAHHFLKTLRNRAAELYRSIPAYVALEATRSEDSSACHTNSHSHCSSNANVISDNSVTENPHQLYDACIRTLEQIKKCDGTVGSLCNQVLYQDLKKET